MIRVPQRPTLSNLVLSCAVLDDSTSAGAGGKADGVLLEQLMDLLDRPLYTMSGPDLDELLQLIEVLVAPLANLKQVTTAHAGRLVFERRPAGCLGMCSKCSTSKPSLARLVVPRNKDNAVQKSYENGYLSTENVLAVRF